MKNSARIDVKNWCPTDIPPRYDLAIATIGYENRSSYLWRTVGSMAASSYAFGFAQHEVLSFERNLAFYNKAGFSVDRPDGTQYRTAVQAALLASAPDRDMTRV